MRKVFINRWFMLASLLTISLSAFSLAAFKNTGSACGVTPRCDSKPANKGDMLWDLLGNPLPSVSFQ